jgi:hypothetical protein
MDPEIESRQDKGWWLLKKYKNKNFGARQNPGKGKHCEKSV